MSTHASEPPPKHTEKRERSGRNVTKKKDHREDGDANSFRGFGKAKSEREREYKTATLSPVYPTGI
jgi:hypothetical protein